MADDLAALQAQPVTTAERIFVVTVSCPEHPSWAAKHGERFERQLMATSRHSHLCVKADRVQLSRGRIRMSCTVKLPAEPFSKFNDVFGFDYRSVTHEWHVGTWDGQCFAITSDYQEGDRWEPGMVQQFVLLPKVPPRV
jgi:hypothetical protein